MKALVEFGETRRRQVGCRVSFVDNGKWRGKRNTKLTMRFVELMKGLMASRITDEDFRCQFSFWIEPHKVEGVLAEGKGTCDISFCRKKNCRAEIGSVGYRIYELVYNALKVDPDGEGGAVEDLSIEGEGSVGNGN